MRKYLNYKNGFWAYVIASLITTILVAEFVLDMFLQRRYAEYYPLTFTSTATA